MEQGYCSHSHNIEGTVALSDNYKIVISIVLGPLHHMNVD